MKRALFIFALALMFCAAKPAKATTYTLSWTLPTNLTGIGFYRLFWGTSPGDPSLQQQAYPNAIDVAGGNTATSQAVVLPSNTYYFAVMSIGDVGSGGQSPLSNEVSTAAVSAPPNAATGLGLTWTIP